MIITFLTIIQGEIMKGLKVIIWIGVSLCVLFIVIQIGKNSIIDKTVLKDKDTLAKSIIQDKNALNELIIFLQTFDDTSIVKNSAEKNFKSYKGYKNYNNSTLTHIFKKYKLWMISIDENGTIIKFKISKYKRGIDYWGFYYSEDGTPYGWYDKNKYLHKDGIGYREKNNCNYYTEPIDEKWYYYEVSF